MKRSIFTLGLLALLSACTKGPDFSRPAEPTDTGYSQKGAPTVPSVAGAGTEQHFAIGHEISAEWWKLFQSSALDQVLVQAVDNNRTLAAATASLRQAHEAVLVATGGYYPRVDFGASATRERNNFKAVGLTGFPPKEFNVYSLGPTVSYTVDVFGEITRQVEQEQALEEAQNYQLQAAYLTLTGSTVTEAITIASLGAQIKAVEDILTDDEQNLRLVRDQLNAGTGTDIDLETATAQLATDRTLLPPLRQQLTQAQDALTVLVGKTPASWSAPDFVLDALSLPGEVPVSLPSALVRQRPDILVTEAQLHAASAAVGVATAQLYPQITLSASVAQQFLKPDTIFDPASNIWSIGSTLAAPLFHGGSLQAQKRGAEDAFQSSLATYEQTVLEAFAQVADLLAALGHDAELLSAEQAAYEAASRALSLTRTSFSLGNTSLLQVLDTQRNLEQARLGLARAQAQRYLDTAQLFVAMGGGWWGRAPAQTAATPR